MYAFDGQQPKDRQLWQSYVRTARDHVIASGAKPRSSVPAIVDGAEHVLDGLLREALQTIVFSAFVLEYRLKRVLSEMGHSPGKRDGLDAVLHTLWPVLSKIERIDKKGLCSPPPGWPEIEGELRTLQSLRNAMAHADFKRIVAFLGEGNPQARAKALYNAVVKAIVLINLGTGYDPDPPEQVWERFEPLLMRD